MPRKRIAIYAPGSINSQPALGRNSLEPYLLENLDYDTATGDMVLRQGYVLDNTPVHGGNGNDLHVVNFIGDATTNPYKKIYAVHPEESFIHSGHRIFVAGVGTANRWFDAESGTQYA